MRISEVIEDLEIDENAAGYKKLGTKKRCTSINPTSMSAVELSKCKARGHIARSNHRKIRGQDGKMRSVYGQKEKSELFGGEFPYDD
jgi:hypothetical protein